MDRFALFVDAGYVYAAGGLLCHGTKDRSRLDLNFQTFVDALSALARQDCSMEHLRTYWYDGAPKGIASLQHERVSRLKGVKLRLGHINNAGQQKGVDSLIVRDLMKLSSEHGIGTAYLLSGDEDLRQGMIEAQDNGVKVVLLGIQSSTGNQSDLLVREADDHMVLDTTFLNPHLTLVPTPTTAAASAVPMDATPEMPEGTASARRIGSDLGTEWLKGANPEEVTNLVTAKRSVRSTRIPAALDRELLARGRNLIGSRLDETTKREIRQAFWDEILRSSARD